MKTTHYESSSIILSRPTLIKQVYSTQPIEKPQVKRLSPQKNSLNAKLRNHNYSIKLEPLPHGTNGNNNSHDLAMKIEIGDKKTLQSKSIDKSFLTDKSIKKCTILDTSIDSNSSEKNLNITNRLIFTVPQKKQLPKINYSSSTQAQQAQNQIILKNPNDHSNLIKPVDKPRNRSYANVNRIRDRPDRDRDMTPSPFLDKNKENNNFSNLSMNINNPYGNAVVVSQSRKGKITIPRILINNMEKSLAKAENTESFAKISKALSRKVSVESPLLVNTTKDISRIYIGSNPNLLVNHSLPESIKSFIHVMIAILID